MKWRHWLVWGLLASWAIGLGACVSEQRYTEAQVQRRIAEATTALQQKNAELRQRLANVNEGLGWAISQRDRCRRELEICRAAQ